MQHIFATLGAQITSNSRYDSALLFLLSICTVLSSSYPYLFITLEKSMSVVIKGNSRTYSDRARAERGLQPCRMHKKLHFCFIHFSLFSTFLVQYLLLCLRGNCTMEGSIIQTEKLEQMKSLPFDIETFTIKMHFHSSWR